MFECVLASDPELVLYKCDKKTPAFECFKGEGCLHDSVREYSLPVLSNCAAMPCAGLVSPRFRTSDTVWNLPQPST